MNNNESLRVLGIDPGMNITGYGVLEQDPGGLRLLDAGVIRSTAKLPLPERLFELYSGLIEILDSFHPVVMGLEKIYSHYKHPATAIIMAHARGVMCLAAHQKGVSVQALPATRIKKLVTGNGRASKEQVNGMVKHLLGIAGEVKPLDISDALAAAIAVLEMNRYA